MADKEEKNRFDTSVMSQERGSAHSGRPPGGGFFEIRIRGQLDGKWSDWLEGLEVKLLDTGVMILSGYLVDQAALMGVLDKLNRLNLTLLSVREVNQQE